MRIRLVKDSGKFKAGEVTEVGIAEGNELLQSGAAEQSKDMTQTDYKTKEVQPKGAKQRGNSRILRTNLLSRR